MSNCPHGLTHGCIVCDVPPYMRADANPERANWVAAPHFYNLNQACAVLQRAFPQGGVYLVGSALKRRDHRDVDVRLILEDEAYDKLFTSSGQAYNALWSIMCTSISMWLGDASALPIDFQIQRQTQANLAHTGRRHPLGIFLDYPGETPATVIP
jgi:hypothetical protein